MSAKPWTAAIVHVDRVDKDPPLKAIFLTLFDLENRVRALEGRPPVTRAQALAALKARADD